MNLKAEIKAKLDKIAAYFDADESTEVTAEATTTEETTETVTEFAEVTLMDGETVLSYDGELAEGTAVFIVLDGEQAPAVEGTYELGGDMEGVSITLDAEGVILEVVDSREDVEASEETADEAMSSEDVTAIVDSKLSEIDTPLNAILTSIESLIEENTSLKNELKEFKADFNKFKNEPSKEEETKKFNRNGKELTRRERYLANLRKNS